MVEVSRLYYDDRRSQQEIAARLEISRASVSRLLMQARGEGLVRITIRDPFADEERLERRLIEAFGLRLAAVSKAAGADRIAVLETLGERGAEALEAELRPGAVVGVTASHAVRVLTRRLALSPLADAMVVPLMGGWGADGCDWHANANARVLAEAMGCGYLECHAPAYVASEATRDALLREPSIARVMDVARRCTAALVGVGQLDREASIVQSGYFTIDDLSLAASGGAVAQLGPLFIDRTGGLARTAFDRRAVAISAQDIRRIPTVIAVAGGPAKVEPVRAALRGGWLHGLVTDADTARGILSGADGAPGDGDEGGWYTV